MSQQHDTAEKVLGEIESRHVTMRPRWQFVVTGAAAVASMIATAILAIYVVNLLVFKLRQEVVGRPMHGATASYFAQNFPWLALGISLGSLALLFWLVKRFDFAYRIGRWTVLAILVLSAAVGSALAFTSFNNHVQQMEPFQRFYGPQQMQQHNQPQENQPSGPHGMMGPRTGKPE